MIIEIDGYSHQFKHRKDVIRDKELGKLGYTVLRFTEAEVKHDMDALVWQLEKFFENMTNNK